MDIFGEVLVNDMPVDVKAFRKASAYVQSQDDLPTTETVRVCLMFSAQLRLPPSLSRAQRTERVRQVLSDLVSLVLSLLRGLLRRTPTAWSKEHASQLTAHVQCTCSQPCKIVLACAGP
jgi:hypothetical protein